MNATLEHIWRELADQLRAFIRRRVRDPETAEDILQDVFLKLSRQLEQVQDPATLQGWLYRVARNAIIDHYRTRKDTVQVPEDLVAETVENNPDAEQLKTAFRRMVYSLPDPYRDALVLTEFEGLTQKQLADRLNLSLSGAKSRVQRGRDQLREMLFECCRFEFDRRGKVIDCAPRRSEACPECSSNDHPT